MKLIVYILEFLIKVCNLMKSRLSLLLLTIIALCSFSDKDHLEQNFLSPPESVKTSVYWYWMCGNISKEGVVKDLEEMFG